MSEFMITENGQPPLTALILSSWEEGLYRCRSIRTKREYKPFFKAATSYFQVQFSRFGIKKMGLIEMALSDPKFRRLVTSPTRYANRNHAAYLHPDEVDPRVVLNLAIQLSGSPLEKVIGPNNKMVEGPGYRVPHLPTPELEQEWGHNVGLLQAMTIVFNAGGKVKDFKWAQGQNMTVNAAMMRFALNYGLENELRAWSDPSRDLVQARLSDLQGNILSYNRDLRAQFSRLAHHPGAPMTPAAPAQKPAAKTSKAKKAAQPV